MGDKEKLYNLLKETFILLDDGDRRLFNHFALTPPRFYVLLHVSEEPGISSSNLSDRMLCDKSNVTRIVKGLEAEGYLIRKPHETDGRSLRLFLTESGEEILGQVQSAHKNYNKNRLDCIESNEQTLLLKHLSKLHDSLLTILTDNNGTNGFKG